MDNIEDVFEDLTEYVMIENNKELNLKLPNTIVAMKSCTNAGEPLKNILKRGARVKIFWSKDDCKDTGWHEGWYLAIVKEVLDFEETMANITYVVEPKCLYEMHVSQLLNEGHIMLHNGSELEQFFEIGSQVKVKWTKDEIGDSHWRRGWYVGEVQTSDLDSDEIEVMFYSEPDVTYCYDVTFGVANGSLQMVNAIF